MMVRPSAVLLAPVAAFGVLLGLVAGRWSPLVAGDRALSARALAFGHDHPAWVSGWRLVTDAGATVTFLAAGSALTVVLLIRRRYAEAAATGLVICLVPALWGVLHLVLFRPRPAGGFVTIESNGFPSGHTSHATALALLAVLLLWDRRHRVATVACAVLFAVAIGVSRVVLLAHWPSDVLGGWLLGTAVVLLVWETLGRRQPPLHQGRDSGGS
jgi:membrane-associated phospholipid phosphatase